MKQAMLCLFYWGYINLASSFPVEEKPGFTPWSPEKRALNVLTDIEFSGYKNSRLGIFEKSHFGVPDPTCRGKMLENTKCWSMDHFTVDEMVMAREKKAKDCPVPCLFYTEKLSGAAERSANFVLWDVLLKGAEEGIRNFQTIWDLHDAKFYPRGDKLDDTPEVKCAYQDADELDRERGHNGCQRLYFMSMSKAMAAECKDEVFLLTRADLAKGKDVPEDGIWWQVEFPTLIDDKRADKKVTKITYIQVRDLTEAEFKEKQDTPDDEKEPPEVIHTGEYWPNGPGKLQLDRFKARAGKRGNTQQIRSPSISGNQADSQQESSPSTNGFVKRADREKGKICKFEDKNCYPYPYTIKDMYEWYKNIL